MVMKKHNITASEIQRELKKQGIKVNSRIIR